MEIRSVSNDRIRLLRKAYTHRKVAREENIFFLPGINLFREFIDSGRNFRYILYAPSRLIEKNEKSLLRKLEEMERSYTEKVLKVTRVILEKFSPVAEDQGVMVVGERFQYTLKDILTRKNIIFLYDVQDPGNVGTIMRLAEGNEASLILTENSASPFNEKVVRASMGSILRTPFFVAGKPEETLELLRKENFKLISTSTVGDKPFTISTSFEKRAFILGNEGHGIPEKVMKLSDVVVNIPMKGKINSYNVAISAALLLCPLLAEEVKS